MWRFFSHFPVSRGTETGKIVFGGKFPTRQTLFMTEVHPKSELWIENIIYNAQTWKLLGIPVLWWHSLEKPIFLRFTDLLRGWDEYHRVRRKISYKIDPFSKNRTEIHPLQKKKYSASWHSFVKFIVFSTFLKILGRKFPKKMHGVTFGILGRFS